MYKLLIKYFFIIVCSFYVYNKILNIKDNKKLKYISYALFSCLLSLITSLLTQHVDYIELPLWIIFSFFFIKLCFGTDNDVSLTAILISYCCSYISFVISAIIFSLFLTITGISSSKHFLILQFFVGILQNILIRIPFRLKRLKNGMPFLTNPVFNNIGIYISMLVLFVAMLLNNGNDNPIYAFAVIFILMSLIFIIVWWKSQLTKSYIYKLKNKEIEELNNTLENKNKRIKEMENEISCLSKIIHKDNKLIPAMELAVKNFLNNPESGNGNNLVIELERLSEERKGIVHSLELSNKKLISTNILSIDSLMNYFLNKTYENGIDFNINTTGNVKDIVENVISESDLNTLVADIIENAVISTKYNNGHHILAIFDAENRNFSIDIFDSGEKFDVNVLLNFGIKKITTHGNDSGSGIGLMTTHEILSKYKASFAIEEFETTNSSYTKKVSIVFDSKNLFTLKSKRTPEEIFLLTKRKDLIFEPVKI